jgi:hypothetical protein
MSRKSFLSAAIVASILLVLLGGCSLLGIDLQDRLSLFISLLNASDRSTINAQFDQSATQNLPLMDATWWNTYFPSPPDTDHLYTITLLDYSDPANVLATIMGPPAFNSNTGVPRNAVLVMSKEGTDWFIEQLYLDMSSTALIR